MFNEQDGAKRIGHMAVAVFSSYELILPLIGVVCLSDLNWRKGTFPVTPNHNAQFK